MDILLPWRQTRNGTTGGNDKNNRLAIAGGGRAAGVVEAREAGGGHGNGNVNHGNNGNIHMGFLNNLPIQIPFFGAPNIFRRNENQAPHQRNQQQAVNRDLPLPGQIAGQGAGTGGEIGTNTYMSSHDFHKYYQQDDNGSSPLTKVLDELNMSILPHDVRLAAILKASQLFDHRDRTKHDYELHEGASKILYQKLAFVLTLCVQSYDEESRASSRSYDASSAYNMSAGSGTGIKFEASARAVTGTGAGANAHIQGLHINNNPMEDEASAVASMSMSEPHASSAMSMNMNNSSTATGTATGNMYIPSNTNTSIASMQRMRSTRSSCASDADYEISILTSCLEMVHRASNESITSTWHSIGHEALPILVKLLERPFDKIQSLLAHATQSNYSATMIDRNLAQAINRENKLSVQKITKILAVYSLIPEAKMVMANCPGLLTVLVKITDTQNINRMKTTRPVSKRIQKRMSMNTNTSANDSGIGSTTMHMNASVDNINATTGANGINGSTAGAGLYMTEAARFNAIAVLTNLAAVEQNRMLMLSEPGLVDNIARVVHNERSDVARQCSSLAIMNLSNGDREHVPELAGNDLILDTIIKLMKDNDLETRRNAAIALFNVACADENTVKLVRYKDGIIIEVLMQCLSTYEDDENEINNDVRTNVAEALFNMSCSSIEETTDRMANHAGLLETLAIELRSPMGCKEVKLYCAATLRRMAEIIHAPKQSQLELLSALVKAQVWTRTPCIAEAFLSQAQHESNRHVMVGHNGLLNAMSKLALSIGRADSEKIRLTTVSAIEHLSREKGSREILSQHEGIMLAMTRASYLVTNLSREDEGSIATTPSVAVHRSVQMALKHLVSAM